MLILGWFVFCSLAESSNFRILLWGTTSYWHQTLGKQWCHNNIQINFMNVRFKLTIQRTMVTNKRINKLHICIYGGNIALTPTVLEIMCVNIQHIWFFVGEHKFPLTSKCKNVLSCSNIYTQTLFEMHLDTNSCVHFMGSYVNAACCLGIVTT